MNFHARFLAEVERNVRDLGSDPALAELALRWLNESARYKYSYNFSWLGRPIIQHPQDIVAVQEILWSVKPDLVIETGIAHGGSLILSASILALLDYADAVEAGGEMKLLAPRRRVLGIDVEIREHNRRAVEAHPLSHRIAMLQGSSIAPEVVGEVARIARAARCVLVILDSNHTHDHVLAELEAYAPLVSPGSYCVTMDTVVEDMPEDAFPDRPWGKGNNPKTAVAEYLNRLEAEGRTASDGNPLRLQIDKSIEHKLMITVAPDGYLKRV